MAFSRLRKIISVAFDIGFLAGMTGVMNRVLAWNLRPAELGSVIALAMLAVALARGWSGWGAARRFAGWHYVIAAWMLVAAGVWLVSRLFSHPLSLRETAYLGAASLGLNLIFRTLRRALSPDGDNAQEGLRLLTLLFSVGWLFYFFFTSRLLGGTDARWYGYVMTDALEQARAGVFPVFVGQSEYMYNGAIHPYRTAPYYHLVGIGIDLLTGRTLAPLAVQHLVVILTAMLAAITSYVCLVLLSPGRRWMAWALALLYVSGPAVAVYIYASEMYMTFTTFAWLPLLLYGNVRLIRQDDRAGWMCVAAALGLIWCCHAPVSIWASIFTVGIQALRLLTRDYEFASWRRAMVGGLLLSGLLAYYFHSISEMPPGPRTDTRLFLIHSLGLVLGLVALIRLLASGCAGWLAMGAASMGILWWADRPHAVWLALALATGSALNYSGRWFPGFKWRNRLPECLLIILLASGIVALRIMPDPNASRNYMHKTAVEFVLHQFPQNFLPLSPQVLLLGDLQPGDVALALLVLALAVSLFRSDWELRVLALAGMLLGCMLAPVPGVTTFLYSVVPDPVYGICSVGLWLRFLPVLVIVAVFAGGLSLMALTMGRHSRPWRGLAFLLLSAALGWNYLEAKKVRQRGSGAVGTFLQTEMFYRTENAALYYGYDRLPQPQYITSGILDYHLESRLLNVGDHSLMPEPLLSGPGETTITFSTHPNQFNPNWFHLEPNLVLPPLTHLLLNFEFFDKRYAGIFTITGKEFQRTYYLPNGGPYEKSFGVGASRPKTLSLWNTRSQPMELQLLFMADAVPDGGKPFGDFARVRLQKFQPGDLRIKTFGLIPYRAEVTLASPAYLETPRNFIRGYRATVNGHSVTVEESSDHLVMVRLEPGKNTVEIAYRGTLVSWILLVFSSSVWFAVLGYSAWRLRIWLAVKPDVVGNHGMA